MPQQSGARAVLPVFTRLFGRGNRPSDDIRILVAVDGSTDSRSAIVWLPQWFDSPKASVTVATVVSEGASPDDVRAAWARVGAGRLAISRRDTHAVVLTGDPAVALRHYAEHNQVSVVVLGTRGDGCSPGSLGSVATAFARDSGMVVLFVEDDAARRLACAGDRLSAS